MVDAKGNSIALKYASCDVSAPSGSHLIVYSFYMLQIEKCKILFRVIYPPIVKLNSLLGRPTCKKQKHISEDFMYLHH